MDKFEEYFRYFEENINSIKGLIFGCFILFIVFNYIIATLGVKLIAQYTLTLNLLLILIWFVVWIILRKRLPIIRSKKIGIILSIKTENHEQHRRTYKDLELKLKDQIIGSGMGDTLKVVSLNQYQAAESNKIFDEYSGELEIFRESGKLKNEKIVKNWIRFANKTKGHLFIWGNLRKRENGTYYLDVKVIVKHIPINKSIHQVLAEEIGSTWLSRFSFGEVIELHGIEYSAEMIYFVSNYILGLASLVSSDPYFALQIHSSLKKEINNGKRKYITLPPNLNKIENELNTLIPEEHILIAKHLLLKKDFNECEEHLSEAKKIKPDHFGIYMIEAIKLFEKKNIEGSMEAVQVARKLINEQGISTQSWRYSYAFLLMYKKEYEHALRQYKKIINRGYPDEAIVWSEVKNFLLDLKTEDEEFIESLFILGYLLYYKESNLPMSLLYLSEFKEKAKRKKQYHALVDITDKLVLNINSSLKKYVSN